MSRRPEHLLQQHRLRQQFERKLDQLSLELRCESARRHLDHILDHLEDLLEFLDCTAERENYRCQLEGVRRIVARRHNLRVVR